MKKWALLVVFLALSQLTAPARADEYSTAAEVLARFARALVPDKRELVAAAVAGVAWDWLSRKVWAENVTPTPPSDSDPHESTFYDAWLKACSDNSLGARVKEDLGCTGHPPPPPGTSNPWTPYAEESCRTSTSSLAIRLCTSKCASVKLIDLASCLAQSPPISGRGRRMPEPQ